MRDDLSSSRPRVMGLTKACPITDGQASSLDSLASYNATLDHVQILTSYNPIQLASYITKQRI